MLTQLHCMCVSNTMVMHVVFIDLTPTFNFKVDRAEDDHLIMGGV